MSEAEDVVTSILGRSRSAQTQGALAIDADPEKASRAVQLSEVTGVPAPAIMGDFDEFDAGHKRNLTRELIRSNRHLSDYVNANPIHSQISNDDWGQLDAVSQSVVKFGSKSIFDPTVLTHKRPGGQSILGATMEGFKHGFGEEAPGNWITSVPGGREFMQNYPGGAAAWTALGLPIEFFFRAVGGATDALGAGVGEYAKQVGAGEAMGNRLTRDIIQMANVAVPELVRSPMLATHAINSQLRDAINRAAPYLEAGVEPPIGIHPFFDDIKKQQHELDLKNLDEALKNAQQSGTRERNPEIFASFIRQHTDAKIGISPEAIALMYGDKIPSPTDNILGWVPRIEEQMKEALAAGTDVEIPLADWLAKVDPEVAKALHDDTRVRPGGLTKNEAKELPEFEKILKEQMEKHKETVDALGNEWELAEKAKATPELPEVEFGGDVPNPVGDLRQALRLDPIMLGTPAQSLKLQKLAQGVDPISDALGLHEFDLVNEQGKPAAVLTIRLEEDGKTLFVEGINTVNQKGNIAWKTNLFGPSTMRDVLRQLKEAFPQAENIEGYRVSGARAKAGEAALDNTGHVKMALGDITQEQIEALTQFLNQSRQVQGEWLAYDNKGTVTAYIKSNEAYTQNERRIAATVDAEIARIAPSADVETTHGIKVRQDGKERSFRGLYIGYSDMPPLIMWSLTNTDPVGTVRHEAIHYLRKQGFFTPDEWTVLFNTAKEKNWQVKHNIDTKYPHLSNAIKMEEAVADEFAAWQRGKKDVPTGVAKLFERLAELFEAIKSKLREILGKDPTFEDLFRKVDSGEVGRRTDNKPIGGRQGGSIMAAVERKKIGDEGGNIGSQLELALRDAGMARDTASNYAIDVDDYKTGLWTNIPWNELEGMDKAKLRKLKQNFQTEDGRNGLLIRVREYEPKTTLLGSVDEPELPGMTRLEDREVFEKANAIGMTVDQYKRYMKLIEKRQAEDLAVQAERAVKEQKKRQTAEWKQNEVAVRQEAAENVRNRPDIAAEAFFREGTLYGQQLETKPRLRTEMLSEEQLAALPKSYHSARGMHPDDAAQLFGFPTGQALIDSLIAIRKQGETANLRPEEFRRRMIQMETDRIMEQRYGKLDDNILEQAKDQLISDTQLDLLHEETLALGLRAGTEYSITKDQMRSWVQQQFEGTPFRDVSTDKFLNAAGRSGRNAEMNLLKEDPAEAFKFKQQQYIAMTMAGEARKLEKDAARLDRTAKRFEKRDIPSVEPEFTDHIQGLLQEAGYNIRKSPQEIADSVEKNGRNLVELRDSTQAQGWDLEIGRFIEEGEMKPLDQMSVEEFRQFKDTIDSLAHIGREIRKIEIAGEKKDFADFRKEVIDNLNQLPVRERGKQDRWFYQADANLVRMEEVIKDLDLRKELGPLFNAVIEPLMLSKAKEFDLLTDLSKHFKTTKTDLGRKWQRSLKDTIDQDFLIDPYSMVPYDLTRENLINVMLNWGNRSNIDKIVRGYATLEARSFGHTGSLAKEHFQHFEQRLKQLIDQHATKEDWDFVQRMWQPFKEWQPMSDTVSRNTSGVRPKWIEAQTVDTPHGSFEGGYWPVKFDRYGSNLNLIEDRKAGSDDLFGPNYYRAATSKGYLKERTGYIDAVDIIDSLEQAAGTMQQVIHDISYRDSLIQAAKIFYDKDIRAAIRKHYGVEYERQLIPWLKKIANHYTADEQAVRFFNNMLKRARINLVGHALPFNFNVLLSPDIGVPNPVAYSKFLANRTEYRDLAMERSAEIRHMVYNMDRDYREAMDKLVKKGGAIPGQAKAVEWGFKPIQWLSQQFRISTFVDKYHEALAKGMSEAEASTIADSHVRTRHGAASIVDLPAVMTSNEGLRALTVFYGYFNTMYNWQRQLPGNLRRGEYGEFMKNALGSVVVSAAFGALLFNQGKENDSFLWTMGKALTLAPLQSIPVLRDAASYVFEGYPSRSPAASVVDAFVKMGQDVNKFREGKPVKKAFQHGANVVGIATGFPLLQAGRTGQFALDVANRKQFPRNFTEYWRGIRTGEARLKK